MEPTPAIRCALRIVLAAAAEPLRPMSLSDLARAAAASPSLVERSVAALCRARLLQPAGGGYRLGLSERAIHVSDVFAALDARPGPACCPLAHSTCSDASPCPLCWTLIEADIAALEVMRRQTIADLSYVLGARRSIAQSA